MNHLLKSKLQKRTRPSTNNDLDRRIFHCKTTEAAIEYNKTVYVWYMDLTIAFDYNYKTVLVEKQISLQIIRIPGSTEKQYKNLYIKNKNHDIRERTQQMQAKQISKITNQQSCSNSRLFQ